LIVEQYDAPTLRRILAREGVRLRTGPVVSRIVTRDEKVAAGISLHYGKHTVEPENGFVDFHVSIAPPRSLRAWFAPQVLFHCEAETAFYPMPAVQAFPMLEWGLNWCVSTRCNQYLMIHSAVIERNGGAMIVPAPPGSGKSTLCAGLVHSGWRLLSDEIALIDPSTRRVAPLPRPVSLKNASIEVIRRFAPQSTIGAPVHDTSKGSVAHMSPTADSVAREREQAPISWVVVPRYVAGAEPRLEPMSRGRAFMLLIENAFNYDIHGRHGFRLLADVMAGSRAFEFTYSRLEDAAEIFEDLANGTLRLS
jgi:HprK-related kinase A